MALSLKVVGYVKSPSTQTSMMADLEALLSDPKSEFRAHATSGDAFVVITAPDPHGRPGAEPSVSRRVAVMIVSHDVYRD